MNKLLPASLVLLSLSLVGCININGDKKALKDYRRAALHDDLTVPDGLDANRINDYYAIPPVRVGLVGEDAEVPEPPALALADEGNLVRIQKFSGESWVLVQLVPGQVWPLVMQYASEQGMTIAREQAGQGFLETGWLVKQGNAEIQEKYRFVVQQGVQRNSTEVRVLQHEQLAQASASGPISWVKRAIDTNSADATLRSMAEYLASYADPTAAVSLRAQNIDTAPRIALKADGDPRIEVQLKTERGFASARFAVEKSNFDVVDIDISKGEIYATSKLDPSKKKKLRKALGLTRKTIWPDHDYVFYIKPDGKQGWLSIKVESVKGLNGKDEKSILKQVKRNFS